MTALLLSRRKVAPARATYASVVLADSPLAYWPLGNITTPAGVVTDADQSGNGRNLTWSGAPTATDLLPLDPGGITLAGTLESSVPSSPVNGWMDSIRTVEAWVKFSSSAEMSIMSRRNTSEHFALYVGQGGVGVHGVVARQVGFSAQDAGITTAINNSALRHVVMTWETNSYALYIDGVSVSAGLLVEAYSQANATDIIRVASETGGRKFNGQIAQVAVYSTQLSAGRVLAHYNARL